MRAGRCDHSGVGPVDRFEGFRRAVLDDPVLQQRLRTITDWPGFVDAAITAAAEHGIDLSPADVLAAREEARRSWRERWV